MTNWKASLFSDGSLRYCSKVNPQLGETITLKISFKENPAVKFVYIRQMVNGENHAIKMTFDKKMNGHDYYKGDLCVNEPLVHYHFMIGLEDEIVYYNQRGAYDYSPLEKHDFKIVADFKSPEWVKNAVFYQIFPDRFHNGNPANDPKPGDYTFDGYNITKMPWGEPPKEYEEVHCLDFYGGDLEGVKAKLTYLKELGVNAIYLNPIFYAATSHKYDCLDYFQVDPVFGGDKALAELTDAMHELDMKLMIDVSINHTGTAHKWFNKEGIFFDKNQGAFLNPGAEERDYYFFDDNGGYKAWMDVETLPTLNYHSEALKDIIYRGPNALVKKWLKPPYNIDAWRFDVASTMAKYDGNQLGHTIWQEIRTSIKSTKEDAYIIGEHWTDATDHLMGDEWDSAMNYFGFTRPVRHFFGDNDLMVDRTPELRAIKTRVSARQLIDRIMQHYAAIPYQLHGLQFNLLDSHDVFRLHNLEGIKHKAYEGAVATLFLLPGTPNVYYGDEIGLEGRVETMEGCRYPMDFDVDRQGHPYFKLYQSLMHLKQSDPLLSQGSFKFIYASDFTLAHARFDDAAAIVTVSSMEEMPSTHHIDLSLLGQGFELDEVLWGESGVKVKEAFLEVTLNAYETKIIRIRKK